MKRLLALSGIMLVASWFLQGFKVWTILITISTALFCSRKIGHFCRLSTVIAIESIAAFLQLMFDLLFKNLVVSHFVITLVIRIIFVVMCTYYIKTYVFVKEVHRKIED